MKPWNNGLASERRGTNTAISEDSLIIACFHLRNHMAFPSYLRNARLTTEEASGISETKKELPTRNDLPFPLLYHPSKPNTQNARRHFHHLQTCTFDNCDRRLGHTIHSHGIPSGNSHETPWAASYLATPPSVLKWCIPRCVGVGCSGCLD